MCDLWVNVTVFSLGHAKQIIVSHQRLLHLRPVITNVSTASQTMTHPLLMAEHVRFAEHGLHSLALNVEEWPHTN